MSRRRATKKDATDGASDSETDITLSQDSHLDATSLLSIIKHIEEQRHKDTAEREQREDEREQREFEREKWRQEETERRERYDREQQQRNDERWDRLLQQRDNSTETLISSSSIANIQVPMFCKQAEDDTDIASFLVNFQSHMESYSVPKRHWPAHLVPVLNRSAQQAHAAFKTTVKQDYDQLRERLLKHFHVNRDSYRRKMFSLKKLPQESWVTHWRRHQQWSRRWIQECKTREEVSDMYDAEIILGKMPPWLVTWIRDKKPRDIEEMMEWVDDHLFNSNRPPDQNRRFQQRGDRLTEHGRQSETEQKPTSAVKREAEQKSGKKQRTDEGTKPWRRPKFDPNLGPRCFSCNEYGHFANACPEKVQQINFIEEEPLAAVIRGKIAGNDVHHILVDTGASKTVIRKQWVPNAAMTGKRLRFAALSGPLQVLPLAVVTLEIDGQKLELEVAVSDNLRYDALLGRDVPFLWNLGSHLQVPDYVGMVQTQAQRKQTDAATMEAEEATKASQANVTSWEEVQEQNSDDSSNRDESVELSETSLVEQQVGEPSEWLDEEASDLPVLTEDLFLPDPARKKLTHSEYRSKRQKYATVSDTSHQLDGGASRLQTAQESDSTLDIIRKSVHNGDKQYLMEDELLYQVTERDGTGECARQLVLPRMYREMALRTAHSVPMAGHLGRKKTMNRLLERFFRPGIYVDVQELCRTCPECQRVACHHKHKAPLMSMPTISADKPGRKMLSAGEGVRSVREPHPLP